MPRSLSWVRSQRGSTGALRVALLALGGWILIAGTSLGQLRRVSDGGIPTFFGGGTLVVVSAPGGLASSKSERPTMADVLASLAPGNGLALVETIDSFGRRSVAAFGLVACSPAR